MKRFALAFAGLVASASSFATVWVQDSFEGTSGSDIHGSSSGAVDNWTVFNGSATTTNGGLSYADAGYSGLVESGNSMLVSGQTAGATGWGQATWVHSNVNNSGGNTFYMSFLFKREDARSQMSVWFNAGWDPGGAWGAYVSGFYSDLTTGELRMNGYNEASGTYPDAGTGKFVGIGETALIVLRSSTVGSQTSIDVALNPSFAAEPVWDGSLSFTRGSFPTWMAFTASGGANFTTQRVDEVLVGNSLAEVTPVPEPATLAVLAGALGLISRGRRQK